MCAKKRVNTGEVEQFGWLDMKKKRVRGERNCFRNPSHGICPLTDAGVGDKKGYTGVVCGDINFGILNVFHDSGF